jgi:lipopolysaccharide transport system ATP-binding protein
MRDTIISIENLSKCYLVGHRSGERYIALRDVIAREARNFSRKAVDAFRGRQIVQGDEVEKFWALKDVSFAVKRGEVIGIIGRNGAGKSTLLKVISRITEPTAGRVRLRGRVASLLEVGTGFHPELTGRENIFLNGVLLGMTRREIHSKFDEIAAFAEVEKFLDTPVKHYSSGMAVRLAFAVAAHLEPEILIVDEVLAVGDANFQQKCLAKMEGVSGAGRTVLFVSHNMAAVQSLCGRVIHLNEGKIVREGESKKIVQDYLSETIVRAAHARQLQVGQGLTIANICFSPNPVESGQDVHFTFDVLANKDLRLSEVTPILYALEGAVVGVIDVRPAGFPFVMKKGDGIRIKGILQAIPLVERPYRVGFRINCTTFAGYIKDAVDLIVSPLSRQTTHTSANPEDRGYVEFYVECSSHRVPIDDSNAKLGIRPLECLSDPR